MCSKWSSLDYGIVKYCSFLPKPSSGFLMSAKPDFFPKSFPRYFTPQIILPIFFSDFFVPTPVYEPNSYCVRRKIGRCLDSLLAFKAAEYTNIKTFGVLSLGYYEHYTASQARNFSYHHDSDRLANVDILIGSRGLSCLGDKALYPNFPQTSMTWQPKNVDCCNRSVFQYLPASSVDAHQTTQIRSLNLLRT